MDYKKILAIFGIIQFIAVRAYIGSIIMNDIRTFNISAFFSDFGVNGAPSNILGGSGAVVGGISTAIGVISFIYLIYRYTK